MTVPLTVRPRARRPLRAAAIFAIAALLVLAVGLPLAAPIARASRAVPALEFGRPASNASGPVSFTVNATDAPAFDPATLRGATPGATVSVTLHNNGSFPHTFTLSSQGNVALNTSWSPAQLDAYFAQNASLLNLSVAAGATTNGSFVVPSNASGFSFEFVSLVPYQFQSGMHGTLVVGAGAPSQTLTDQALAALAFSPSVLVVNQTTYPVTIGIEVTDVGALIHTWTLAGLSNVTLTPTNFTTFFTAHPPLVNLQVASAGITYNASFVIDGPGVYQFICEEPGHFAAGMDGFLYVGVAPPATAAPLSSALVQVDVLVLAGILILVAVVIALSANFLGRFPPPRRPTHH
ncbi:MAG: plastocyanin/azurin family copper-binding protein [Thermoplasmata archaeon]